MRLSFRMQKAVVLALTLSAVSSCKTKHDSVVTYTTEYEYMLIETWKTTWSGYFIVSNNPDPFRYIHAEVNETISTTSNGATLVNDQTDAAGNLFVNNAAVPALWEVEYNWQDTGPCSDYPTKYGWVVPGGGVQLD